MQRWPMRFSYCCRQLPISWVFHHCFECNKDCLITEGLYHDFVLNFRIISLHGHNPTNKPSPYNYYLFLLKKPVLQWFVCMWGCGGVIYTLCFGLFYFVLFCFVFLTGEMMNVYFCVIYKVYITVHRCFFYSKYTYTSFLTGWFFVTSLPKCWRNSGCIGGERGRNLAPVFWSDCGKTSKMPSKTSDLVRANHEYLSAILNTVTVLLCPGCRILTR